MKHKHQFLSDAEYEASNLEPDILTTGNRKRIKELPSFAAKNKEIDKMIAEVGPDQYKKMSIELTGGEKAKLDDEYLSQFNL